MSKSEKNHIGVNEDISQMFGKIMSISDKLMWKYHYLLSKKSSSAIKKLEISNKSGRNIRNIKINLAREIVSKFYSHKEVEIAHKKFTKFFQKKIIPKEMPFHYVSKVNKSLPLANILKQIKLVSSTSEAFRLIRQGAVKIDGVKVTELNAILKDKSEQILTVGKLRVAKIKVG